VSDNSDVQRGKENIALYEADGVPFYEYVLLASGGELRGRKIEVIQVNVGLKCNQSCKHCHLDASPTRTECMPPEIMQEVIDAAVRTRCRLVEITGGSPELHTKFKWFITELHKHEIPIRLRTNLTALSSKGLEDLPELLRDLGVQLIASLPYYREEDVRAQRGKGVYEKSIKVIKQLNSLGYGIDPNLPLYLVYNPNGAFLPPEQRELEEEYRRELKKRFGISFTNLLTMTNMPIGRFLEHLQESGKLERYMTLLRDSFNPATVDRVMCRNQLTVNWDGSLYDCDFNLALDLPIVGKNTIEDLDHAAVVGRAIRTGSHCFGCTAGAGSSCAGALVGQPGE
jgi:radical SAM/Cys-rich protein